ncbi:Nickel uptake substrate-specific transmembrane region [compost metagenome]
MMAEFIPTKKGVYTVWLDQSERPVSDLSKHGLGIVKPNTYCNSIVIIDNDLTEKKSWSKTSEMYIKPLHSASLKQEENIGFLLMFQGKPQVKQTITIVAPNGWSKEVTTNEYGEFYLEPLWTGNYVLEYSYSNKTPGEYQSVKYEQIRYKLSTTLKVTE